MADFIRQLAEEAGRTSISQSVRLRSSGANNDGIKAAIRRQRKGNAVDSLGAGNLNDQIRRGAAANNLTGGVNEQIRQGAGRAHTGSNRGPVVPSFDRNLADQIAQDLLNGGGSDGI